jgi:PKD repeat protein
MFGGRPVMRGMRVLTVVVALSHAPPGLGAVMTTAHRTAGVAPLAVFFDTVNDSTTSAPTFAWASGVTQPSDMEGSNWSWDFGDSTAGTWAQTGKSRNTATGYTAAHVYETPGTYTVTLTVTDPAGTASDRYTQTITVSAFKGSTFYAAAGARGNGLSPSTPGSLSAGVAYLNAGSGRRLLIRRGDTFNLGTSQYIISGAGPGIIDAYADGTAGHTANDPVPVLTSNRTATGAVIQIQANDWRVMNLDMRGPNATSFGASAVCYNPGLPIADMLVMRLKASGGWFVAFGSDDPYGSTVGTPEDRIFYVEVESSGSYSMEGYLGARRLALLGNYFHDTQASHNFRSYQAHKAVLSNNKFSAPGISNRHTLKLHSEATGLGYAESRWISITDNIFSAGPYSSWNVSIGPENAQSDERVSHVIYERNHNIGGPATSLDLEGSSAYTIVRNNIFEAGTRADDYCGVSYTRRGVEPVPENIRIFNNTFYKTTKNLNGSTVNGVRIDPQAINAHVRNNLVVMTGGGGTATAVSGGGGKGWTASNNLLVTNPATSVFTDRSGGHFTLSGNSPAIGAGMMLPEVHEDFMRAARSAGTRCDLGAYKSR